MWCYGYKCKPHKVEQLHGKGLCDCCYQRKYREEHKAEIIKYQRDYRADSTYAQLNRLYVSRYRKVH